MIELRKLSQWKVLTLRTPGAESCFLGVLGDKVLLPVLLPSVSSVCKWAQSQVVLTTITRLHHTHTRHMTYRDFPLPTAFDTLGSMTHIFSRSSEGTASKPSSVNSYCTPPIIRVVNIT